MQLPTISRHEHETRAAAVAVACMVAVASGGGVPFWPSVNHARHEVCWSDLDLTVAFHKLLALRRAAW